MDSYPNNNTNASLLSASALIMIEPIQPSVQFSSPTSVFSHLEFDPVYNFPLLLKQKPSRYLSDLSGFVHADKVSLKQTFNNFHETSPFQRGSMASSECSSYNSTNKLTLDLSSSYVKTLVEGLKRPSLTSEASGRTFMHLNIDTGLSLSTVKSDEVLFDPCAEEVSRFDWGSKDLIVQESQETLRERPSELVFLLGESECDDSQALFNSVDALRQANLLEEEDSINEEGSIRVGENLRVFLSGHASKDKLSEKDPLPVPQDFKPILKPSPNDLLSPLLRKIVVFEEPDVSSLPGSKVKGLTILFTLNTSGFTSSPYLEFSNQKGQSRSSVIPTSETHPLISLFPSKVFKQVKNLNVRLVSCGYEHVALLTIDGKVLTWGYGASGCLGHDNKKSYSYPTAINSIFNKHFQYLECGAYHSAAVSDQGELYTWGRNDVGQLGLSNKKLLQDHIGKASLRPSRVKWVNQLVSTACGEAHTLALNQFGEVFAFGWNEDGQLGLADSDGAQKVKILDRVVKVAAGALFSAVLTEKLEVLVWGNGELGQLGLGSSLISSGRPVKVSGISNIIDITCGENSVLSLSSSNKIYAWGQGTVKNFNSFNYPQGSEVNCFLPHDLSECNILHSVLMKKRKL